MDAWSVHSSEVGEDDSRQSSDDYADDFEPDASVSVVSPSRSLVASPAPPLASVPAAFAEREVLNIKTFSSLSDLLCDEAINELAHPQPERAAERADANSTAELERSALQLLERESEESSSVCSSIAKAVEEEQQQQQHGLIETPQVETPEEESMSAEPPITVKGGGAEKEEDSKRRQSVQQRSVDMQQPPDKKENERALGDRNIHSSSSEPQQDLETTKWARAKEPEAFTCAPVARRTMLSGIRPVSIDTARGVNATSQHHRQLPRQLPEEQLGSGAPQSSRVLRSQEASTRLNASRSRVASAQRATSPHCVSLATTTPQPSCSTRNVPLSPPTSASHQSSVTAARELENYNDTHKLARVLHQALELMLVTDTKPHMVAPINEPTAAPPTSSSCSARLIRIEDEQRFQNVYLKFLQNIVRVCREEAEHVADEKELHMHTILARQLRKILTAPATLEQFRAEIALSQQSEEAPTT